MKVLYYNKKLLAITVTALVFIIVSGIYMYATVLESADEIIESNKEITRTAAGKLSLRFEDQLLPIWEGHLLGKDRLTKAEERLADSLLSVHIEDVLSYFNRVEGGLYFFKLDNFVGYSFPTIEPPIPAFGPPPRSYNIIRDQVRQTIESDTLLTDLHQFDPAIFPLSTQPIYHDGELIGAAWARIHIERELARSQTIQSGTFFLTVGLILIGLAISLYFIAAIRKRLKGIKNGLELMKQDPDFRLHEPLGPLGFINRSINELTDVQQKEQEKNKELERELFQKEKMASLGNLVAGAAHEINTPISIIKTRIQIWERKLRKGQNGQQQSEIIKPDSLAMIRSEIDRISNLTKRLLYFSKPISNKKEMIHIDQLIRQVIDRICDAYNGQNIQIRYQPAEDIPAMHVDFNALEQVFTNILNNAIQASGTNCVVDVNTQYNPENETISVKIRDYGTGLPKKQRNRIFDPFFTTKVNGSGLGLSISNEIVKAHHGTISFVSPVNEDDQSGGTLCIISLPAGN